jgi:hypothetical protein
LRREVLGTAARSATVELSYTEQRELGEA